MADKTVRYTPEFRRQMVALARSGRTAVYMEDLGGAEMFDLHAVPVSREDSKRPCNP